MSKKYLKLKPNEGFTTKYDMKNFEIEHINLYSEKKEMEVFLNINDYEAKEEIKEFRQLLYKKLGNELMLKIRISVKAELVEKDMNEFIKFIIENYKAESMRHQYIFANYEIESLEDEIFIKLPSEHMIEEGKKTEILRDLSKRMLDITNKNFNIEFTTGDFKDIKKAEEGKEILKNTVKAQEIPKIKIEEEDTKNNWKDSKKNTSYNGGFKRKVQDREASEFSILESLNTSENIALEGQIFHVDTSETKNGNLKCDFLITDYNDSIGCRIFAKDTTELKDINLNDWVKVNGIFEADRFTGEYYINTKRVDKIEPKIFSRKDNAEKKRIELHAHTNMSEMSGVVSAKDLAKRAKEFGHSAVAVTDFGVVHSFPFAYKESDENFKIIFGMEAYVVDDE